MNSLLSLIIVLILYFIPTALAIILKHKNIVAIGALNLLLGWTGIGWIIAIIWAVKK